MKQPITAVALVLLLTTIECIAQEVTPETPVTPMATIDDVTIELVYLGMSKTLSANVVAQGYVAYGYDDDIGLAIADLGRAVNKNVQLGGRYVFFGSTGNSDQHSVWGYLNAEKYFSDSWRVDTRQVIEYRFDTSGVSSRTRYRPRFRVSYFGKLAARRYQAYASVESIFNLTDDNEDQTSWAVGGFLEIGKHAQFNVFYQFTDTERGPDFHFPGIGLLLSY